MNAGASGIYFGVNGAVLSLATIGGVSQFGVSLAAAIFSVLASEFIKIRARTIEEQRTRVGNGPSMYELMRFKEPSMNQLMSFSKDGVAKAFSARRPIKEITAYEVYAGRSMSMIEGFVYFSILLTSYVLRSSALESPSLLSSYSIISLA